MGQEPNNMETKLVKPLLLDRYGSYKFSRCKNIWLLLSLLYGFSIEQSRLMCLKFPLAVFPHFVSLLEPRQRKTRNLVRSCTNWVLLKCKLWYWEISVIHTRYKGKSTKVCSDLRLRGVYRLVEIASGQNLGQNIYDSEKYFWDSHVWF